jgi:FkbM family methyltransferase
MIEFEPFLKEIVRRVPRCEYEIVAAGESAGSLELFPTGGLTGTSGFVKPENGQGGRVVPMKPLDEIVTARGKRGPFVIKLDTQGAEFSVLRGSTITLQDTALVIAEISVRAQGSEPEFHVVHGYLREKGFALFDAFSPQYSPRTGRLSQLDFAFVPVGSILRAPGPYRTDAQRASNFRRKGKALKAFKVEI